MSARLGKPEDAVGRAIFRATRAPGEFTDQAVDFKDYRGTPWRRLSPERKRIRDSPSAGDGPRRASATPAAPRTRR